MKTLVTKQLNLTINTGNQTDTAVYVCDMTVEVWWTPKEECKKYGLCNVGDVELVFTPNVLQPAMLEAVKFALCVELSRTGNNHMIIDSISNFEIAGTDTIKFVVGGSNNHLRKFIVWCVSK